MTPKLMLEQIQKTWVILSAIIVIPATKALNCTSDFLKNHTAIIPGLWTALFDGSEEYMNRVNSGNRFYKQHF